MSYNENTAQMICSQHDGIGPVNVVDKDWYKKLLKIALCSDAPMKVFSCTAIAKKDNILTLQSSTDCKYVPGQSIIVTSDEISELNGTYVIVSAEIPNKFSIKISSEISLPTSDVFVSLKTGSWSYTDVNEDITDFFPRDYVAGEDYFIRLDNTPFKGLTTSAFGRASEFMIMLDLEGELIQINSNTKMSLPTRIVPSKSYPGINPTLIQPRHKTWSLFFDHESVYFFSGIRFGLHATTSNTAAGTSSSYTIYADQITIPDEYLVNSNSSPLQQYAVQYNMFYMGNLLGSNNTSLFRDGLVAFCFTTIKPSEWYGNIPKIERRIYSAPSFGISSVTNADFDYIISITNYPSHPNLKACVLPVRSTSSNFDVMTRFAKLPNSTTLDSRVALELIGGAVSGLYPFHEKQVIGKEYYTIRTGRIPLGVLNGRVAITSNITKQLITKVQRVDGGSTSYSLLANPVERYEDDSVLIAISRGVGGGATVEDNSNYIQISGYSSWDGMLIGGVWSA